MRTVAFDRAAHARACGPILTAISPRARLWLWWVIASAAGGALVGGVPLPIPVRVLAFGALFALPQWPIVRLALPHGWRWVPATAAGALAAWVGGIGGGAILAIALATITQWPGSLYVGILLGALAAGGLVGGAQCAAFHGQIRRPGRWVLASAAGGLPMGLLAFEAVGVNPWLPVLGLCCGAVYGLLTGPILAQQLPSTPPESGPAT